MKLWSFSAIFRLIFVLIVRFGVKSSANPNEIRSACFYSNAEKLSTLMTSLAEAFDVDEQFDDGWSCLHFAAANNDVVTIDLLLKRGADPNGRRSHNVTALHDAAISGHGEAILALRAGGADLESVDDFGQTSLRLAVTYGRVAAVETLVKLNASLEMNRSDFNKKKFENSLKDWIMQKALGVELDLCLSRPCQNGAACANRQDGVICSCRSGWRGDYCTEEEPNNCESNPCHNGASCINGDGSFTCQCPQSYIGDTCNEKIKPIQITKTFHKIDKKRFEDEKVTLSCAIKERIDESCEKLWKINGKEIEASSRLSTFCQIGNSTLTIESVQTDDAAIYTCAQSHSNWIDFNVTVKRKLRFKSRPRDVVLLPFVDHSLPCSVSGDEQNFTIEWFLGEKLIALKTFRASNGNLSHEISNASAKSDVGRYECRVTSQSSGKIMSTKAWLNVTANLCTSETCKYLGTCRNLIKGNMTLFVCNCLPGFTGRDCSRLDKSHLPVMGIRDLIASTGPNKELRFDNRNKQMHKVKLKCDFGNRASNYSWWTIAPSGRKNRTKKNEQILEMELKSPNRDVAESTGSDHNIIINCTALLGKQLIWDSRRVKFYEFYKWGEKSNKRLSAEQTTANASIHWKVNGANVENEDSTQFNMPIYGYTGSVQIISAESQGLKKSQNWAVITCAYDKTQFMLLCVSLCLSNMLHVVMLLCQVGKGRELSKFGEAEKRRRTRTEVNSSPPSKYQRKNSNYVTFKNFFTTIKDKLTFDFTTCKRWPDFLRLVEKCKHILTMIQSLCLIDLLAAAAFFLRQDYWWCFLTLLILFLSWFFTNLLAIHVIFRDPENYPSFLSNKIWLILKLLFNQTEHMFNRDYRSSKNELSKSILTRKRIAFNRISTIGIVKNVSMLYLNAYILFKLFGIEHMCLPNYPLLRPWTTHSNWSRITREDFRRFSVSSKMSALVESLLDDDQWVMNPEAAGTREPCSCTTFQSDLGSCFPPNDFDSTAMNMNKKCIVADCYDRPFVANFFFPLLCFAKSVFFISVAFCAKLTDVDLKKFIFAFRIFFFSWTMCVSLLCILYITDTLKAREKSESINLIWALSILTLIKLATCCKSGQRFRSCYCVASVFHSSLYLVPAYLLHAFKGCDENPRNRVTILTAKRYDEEILFFRSNLHYWRRAVEEMYGDQFRIEENHLLRPQDSRGQLEMFYNLRYDFNYVIYLFTVIGYIALVDFVLNLVNFFVCGLEAKFVVVEEEMDEEIERETTPEGFHARVDGKVGGAANNEEDSPGEIHQLRMNYSEIVEEFKLKFRHKNESNQKDEEDKEIEENPVTIWQEASHPKRRSNMKEKFQRVIKEMELKTQL